MLRVFVPNFRQVNGELGKQYTVYQVDVYFNAKCQKFERRYNDFFNLHKELKKTITPPEFPPKKVRNWSSKVLEQRRQGLETYMQELIKIRPIQNIVATFLQLPPSSICMDMENMSAENMEPTHQPTMVFTSDPFPEHPDTLPNIVTHGVLQAFYSNFVDK